MLANAGVPLRIDFDRRDEGACWERVIFADADVEATLPAHHTTTIELPPLTPGSDDLHRAWHAPRHCRGRRALSRAGAVALPNPGEDAEAADVSRRVLLGALLTPPVLFGGLDWGHPYPVRCTDQGGGVYYEEIGFILEASIWPPLVGYWQSTSSS